MTPSNPNPELSEFPASFSERIRSVIGDGFELRPGQVEMAEDVARAIKDDSVVVIEGPTGIGKSLAYLLPLLDVCRSGGRVVVATHTRNLQRQLADQDVPAALGTGAPVDYAVLMGRNNYACHRAIHKRLKKGVNDAAWERWLCRLLDDGNGELESVAGSYEYLRAGRRSAVMCPAQETLCSGCHYRDDCFLVKARKRAFASSLVIVNHALLFSNIATGGVLLGPRDVLVVDEAHHLEDAATSFLTLGFGPGSLRGSHDSVYSPEHDEAIAYVRAKVAEDNQERAREVDRLWAEFLGQLDAAEQNVDLMFKTINLNAGNSIPAGREGRVTYAEGSPWLYGTDAMQKRTEKAMGAMASRLAEIGAIAEEVEALVESGAVASLASMRSLTLETLDQFRFLTHADGDDHVFYMNVNGANATGANANGRSAKGAGSPPGVSSLEAAPIDVSAQLGAMLEEGTSSTILTSATLAVGDEFDYALDRWGLSGSPRTRVRRLDSPFEFNEQRHIMVASYMPDPGDRVFLDAAATAIRDVAIHAGRRLLVLCTAKTQVAGLTRRLQRRCPAGVELFPQMDDVSRVALLQRFKESKRGILLGLASFWEGVDLPGDLLEVLVIVKLPFMVPTEPIVQARAARVSANGESPFEKLYMPDVVLKLRQGMGRLIRTSRDRGSVILLDRRLQHAEYGRAILSAVTERFDFCESAEQLAECVGRDFAVSPPDAPDANERSA